jgi:hypothetical protein
MPTAQLETKPLGPEDIGPMTVAYEEALRALGLTKRNPLAEVVARKIIEVVQTGEQNPERIVKLALLELRLTPPKLWKWPVQARR